MILSTGGLLKRDLCLIEDAECPECGGHDLETETDAPEGMVTDGDPVRCRECEQTGQVKCAFLHSIRVGRESVQHTLFGRGHDFTGFIHLQYEQGDFCFKSLPLVIDAQKSALHGAGGRAKLTTT